MKKEEFYFVIGYETITKITKPELLERLDENYYGKDVYFLDEIENDGDTNYWGDSRYLIVKGNTVTPKTKKVITKYDID